jgi:hypothetical protein
LAIKIIKIAVKVNLMNDITVVVCFDLICYLELVVEF